MLRMMKTMTRMLTVTSTDQDNAVYANSDVGNGGVDEFGDVDDDDEHDNVDAHVVDEEDVDDDGNDEYGEYDEGGYGRRLQC